MFSLSVLGNRAIDHPAGNGPPADDWIEEDGPIAVSSVEEEAGEYEEGMVNGYINRFNENFNKEGAGEYGVGMANGYMHWFTDNFDEEKPRKTTHHSRASNHFQHLMCFQAPVN